MVEALEPRPANFRAAFRRRYIHSDLADASKMSLSFYGKRPGLGMRLDKLSLQVAMHDTGMIGDVLEAYERLILDAMRGNHTLSTTAEGIERLREVSIPLLEAPPPVRLYPPRCFGAEVNPSVGCPIAGACLSSGPGATQTPTVADPGRFFSLAIMNLVGRGLRPGIKRLSFT
jgi:hypothetical protein